MLRTSTGMVSSIKLSFTSMHSFQCTKDYVVLDCILILSVLLHCSFLNPSDSENPKIINLLCRQELR